MLEQVLELGLVQNSAPRHFLFLNPMQLDLVEVQQALVQLAFPTDVRKVVFSFQWRQHLNQQMPELV